MSNLAGPTRHVKILTRSGTFAIYTEGLPASLTGPGRHIQVKTLPGEVASGGIGITETSASRVVKIKRPGGHLEHLPRAVLQGPTRKIRMRTGYGIVPEFRVAYDLFAMGPGMEALWLLLLYEKAVDEIREKRLPDKKDGALKVPAPSMEKQANKMRLR